LEVAVESATGENEYDGGASTIGRLTVTPSTDKRIVQFAFWLCVVGGFVGSSTLAVLRSYNLLPAVPYSWAMIIIWPVALAILLPGMLWVVQQRWMRPWFERTGVVFVFGIIPAMIIWMIVQWLTGRPT